MDNQWVNTWKEAVGSNYNQNVTNFGSVRIITKNCGFVFNLWKKKKRFPYLQCFISWIFSFCHEFQTPPFFLIFLDNYFFFNSVVVSLPCWFRKWKTITLLHLNDIPDNHNLNVTLRFLKLFIEPIPKLFI